LILCSKFTKKSFVGRALPGPLGELTKHSSPDLDYGGRVPGKERGGDGRAEDLGKKRRGKEGEEGEVKGYVRMETMATALLVGVKCKFQLCLQQFSQNSSSFAWCDVMNYVVDNYISSKVFDLFASSIDCSRTPDQCVHTAVYISVCPFLSSCLLSSILTNSSAAADRPLDASCLSASIVQYAERKLRFRFTAAYCSLLFVVVVHAGCDKHDSLMRRRLCDKLHGGWSHLLISRTAAVIDR